jgi:hypothetical protein
MRRPSFSPSAVAGTGGPGGAGGGGAGGGVQLEAPSISLSGSIDASGGAADHGGTVRLAGESVVVDSAAVLTAGLVCGLP